MRKGVLFVSTPRGRVLALDAETGVRRWEFDSHLDKNAPYVEGLTTRGVTLWVAPDSTAHRPCIVRVFTVSVDSRLHALDARNGLPCGDFGDGGSISLRPRTGAPTSAVSVAQFSLTSPPVVLGDLVIVGSALSAQSPSPSVTGAVRAFDARTGTQRWEFDAIPRARSHPAWSDWDSVAAQRTSGGNAWSFLTADAKNGLIFVPTASASPAHFGGGRPGRNEMANSVVALRAANGMVEWSFQLVHHDLWDFDVASQPVMLEVEHQGQLVDALVVMSKAGSVFVLDRRTAALH